MDDDQSSLLDAFHAPVEISSLRDAKPETDIPSASDGGTVESAPDHAKLETEIARQTREALERNWI